MTPAGLYLGYPSDAEMITLALRSPGDFGLTGDQASRVRLLSQGLQATLADPSGGTLTAQAEHIDDLEAGEAERRAKAVFEALSAGVAARANAHQGLFSILTPRQYLKLASSAARSSGGARRPASGPHAEDTLHSEGQKAIEIEIATKVAERVLSWAKLFAWCAAIPASLLLAVLAVFGVSKYSDFAALVSESETKLKAAVSQATTNAELLGQRVADLTARQAASDKTLDTLSRDLTTIREKLRMPSASGLPQDLQESLNDHFMKFQAYVRGLGYVPGGRAIQLEVLADETEPSPYYSDNTIFVPQSAASDYDVIYREYLHHILYSKVRMGSIGPERTALESGLSDYFVASYTGSPRIYRTYFQGKPKSLEHRQRLRSAQGHEDRFPVGDLWAGLLWQLRQTIGQKLADQSLFDAWFSLSGTLDDRAVPAEMVARFLGHVAPEASHPLRERVLGVLVERGAPAPSANQQ